MYTHTCAHVHSHFQEDWWLNTDQHTTVSVSKMVQSLLSELSKEGRHKRARWRKRHVGYSRGTTQPGPCGADAGGVRTRPGREDTWGGHLHSHSNSVLPTWIAQVALFHGEQIQTEGGMPQRQKAVLLISFPRLDHKAVTAQSLPEDSSSQMRLPNCHQHQTLSSSSGGMFSSPRGPHWKTQRVRVGPFHLPFGHLPHEWCCHHEPS